MRKLWVDRELNVEGTADAEARRNTRVLRVVFKWVSVIFAQAAQFLKGYQSYKSHTHPL